MELGGFLGQSAIEYLMTYGWMLLIIAIAGGAVFSMVDDQSVESVSGFDSSHVSVQDFGVSTQSGLMFEMQDSIGQVKINEITVSNSGNTNTTYKLNQDVSSENMINLPGINPSEDSNMLDVEVKYDSNNLDNLTTTGTVTGTLDLDENFNNRTLIMNGLKGYWPLDQVYTSGETVYDISENQNHGEKEDHEWGDGVYGMALELDGEDNYLKLSSDTSQVVSDAGEYTITFWSFANFDDTGTYHQIDLLDNANIMVRVRDQRQSIRQGGTSYDSQWDFPVNEWVMTTMTWNGSTIRTYKNGQFQTAIDDVSLGQQGAHDAIGHRASSSDRHWDGKIDEVRVYDRALSQDEVETIYEEGSVE